MIEELALTTVLQVGVLWKTLKSLKSLKTLPLSWDQPVYRTIGTMPFDRVYYMDQIGLSGITQAELEWMFNRKPSLICYGPKKQPNCHKRPWMTARGVMRDSWKMHADVIYHGLRIQMWTGKSSTSLANCIRDLLEVVPTGSRARR